MKTLWTLITEQEDTELTKNESLALTPELFQKLLKKGKTEGLTYVEFDLFKRMIVHGGYWIDEQNRRIFL